MINDSCTDTVYFSDLLPERCPTLYESITDALKENHVSFGLLHNTKDIWCRDYMPIQIGEKHFLFYNYAPDYLKEKRYQRITTDISQIANIDSLRQNSVDKLDLVIDGGNVVKCGDKIVMTEKVFFENKDKTRGEVRTLLENAFQCDVIFIPWDRNEEFGHSDGIIHYIGDNRVLMTNYADFDEKMADRFLKALEKHLEVIPLKYNVRRKHKRSWAYINFLQVDNMVLVPLLDIPEDGLALEQISKAMPAYKVVGVKALEAVRRGGALNCISWNVRTIEWNNGFMGEEYQRHGYTVSCLKEAAAQGRAGAMNILGRLYCYGQGVGMDKEKAFSLFKASAEKGKTEAMFNLGLHYFQEKDDPQTAVSWFQQAAEKGDADAQYFIGRCNEYLLNPIDEKINAYQKAAEMGSTAAMCEVGRIHIDGAYGVEVDLKEAVKWYRKAAELGDSFAQYKMGEFYETGKGVGKDVSKAMLWYRRAAANNDEFAQYSIGCFYYYGIGVRRNRKEAIKWLKKAAMNGFEPAKAFLQEIEVPS